MVGMNVGCWTCANITSLSELECAKLVVGRLHRMTHIYIERLDKKEHKISK